MGEDFRAAPVPIRLSCRYSNGTVVSYAARALAYDDSSLRVLSSENFEKGVPLSVLAPFLGGISSCRVLATSRSQEQPAYFELDLNILKKPAPVPQPKKDSAVQDPRCLIPEDVVLAARELAARLEQSDSLRFSQVLQLFLPAQRLALLGVSSAAVALLLQEKGLLDLRRLVETLNRKG